MSEFKKITVRDFQYTPSYEGEPDDFPEVRKIVEFQYTPSYEGEQDALFYQLSFYRYFNTLPRMRENSVLFP